VDPAAWREQLVQWNIPKHLLEHVAAMAQLNREGRYDRLTDDVQRITGSAPISLREFVLRHREEFMPKPRAA
jgi:hypothetical protein